MHIMKLRLICFLMIVNLCVVFAQNANAVSLSGKATDDSVCDLSPLTSYRLATKTFVEAGTQHSDQIYLRLALRFVTRNCKNNQSLILDSEDGDSFDTKYFKEVANNLCVVANVTRIPTGTAEYPNAFQIKCSIAKIEEAAEWLSSAEKVKSTEAMISEGAPKHSQTATSSAGKPDCSKTTMATIFFGGSGCK